MTTPRQILIADGGALATDATILPLPHPLDASRQCLFLRNGESLLELQRARVPRQLGSSAAATSARKPPTGSWFVGDRVVSDGTFLLATAFDARLLFLPMLTTDMRYFRPVDQLSALEGSSALRPLLRGGAVERLSASLCAVCDSQEGVGTGALPLLRLNPAKLVAWLRAKAERTDAALVRSDDSDDATQATKGGANSSSFSATVAASAKADIGVAPEDRAQLRRARRAAEATVAAVEMLGEWVEARWIEALRATLGLDVAAAEAAAAAAASATSGAALTSAEVMERDPTGERRGGVKRAAGRWEQSEESQMADTMQHMAYGGGVTSKKFKAEEEKPKVKTLAQKKLERVNTKGMASMMSFFQKK